MFLQEQRFPRAAVPWRASVRRGTWCSLRHRRATRAARLASLCASTARQGLRRAGRHHVGGSSYVSQVSTYTVGGVGIASCLAPALRACNALGRGHRSGAGKSVRPRALPLGTQYREERASPQAIDSCAAGERPAGECPDARYESRRGSACALGSARSRESGC